MNNNIKIIHQKANYEDTLRILNKKGLELVTYQELLLCLKDNSQLKKSLKGKWFWISGKGTDKEGIFTFNKNGELRNTTAETSIEDRVRVWSGNQPLSFYVDSDDYTANDGRRFDLYAYDRPDYDAQVVVGKISGKHKHLFVCQCGKVKK